MPDNLTQIAAGLQQQWELRLPATVTEEELLHILALRIAALLERGSEDFFQLIYRLDIAERKLQRAFTETDPPMAIAHLVYERQLQKIQSRLAHKDNNTAEDADLKW